MLWSGSLCRLTLFECRRLCELLRPHDVFPLALEQELISPDHLVNLRFPCNLHVHLYVCASGRRVGAGPAASEPPAIVASIQISYSV